MESNTLPGILNFSIFKGDTFRRNLTVTDDGNAAWNFTGATVKMVISRGETPVLTIQNGQGVSISTNVVSLTITDEQTLALEALAYEYDLIYTNSSGDTRTWMSGAFIVEERR